MLGDSNTIAGAGTVAATASSTGELTAHHFGHVDPSFQVLRLAARIRPRLLSLSSNLWRRDSLGKAWRAVGVQRTDDPFQATSDITGH